MRSSRRFFQSFTNRPPGPLPTPRPQARLPCPYLVDVRAQVAWMPPPDVMKPAIHCVGTHWIRGFMAFQRARYTRIVMLMVLVLSESRFGDMRPAAAYSVDRPLPIP